MELYGKSVLIAETNQNGYYRYYEQIVTNVAEVELNVVSWEKRKWFRSEKGVSYYKCKDEEQKNKETTLYCTCGYEGVPEKTGETFHTLDRGFEVTVDNTAPLDKRYFFMNKTNEKIYFPAITPIAVQWHLVCPVCRKKPDWSLPPSKANEKEFLFEYQVKRQENPSMAVFEWQVLRYTYSPKGTFPYTYSQKNGFSAYKNSRQLKVNLETGETTLWCPAKMKEEETITFHAPGVFERDDPFEVIGESAEAKEAFKVFLESCLKERGVCYKSAEELLLENDCSFKEEFCFEDISSLFPFLRFPQLETVSSLSWKRMPICIQEGVAQSSHREISVFEALTGHRSKSIRLLAEEPENLETCLVFGPIVKDPNNLRKLLKERDECHRFKPRYGFYLWERFPQEMLLFFRNLHQNETQFVQSLLTLHRTVHAFRESFVFDLREVEQDLSDTYSMVKVLQENDLAYSIPFQRDWRKFHDEVTKDYRRLKYENEQIAYKEEEVSLYERTVDGYRFSLTKDTDELVNAGEEMDHCVGSYREQALSGESVIVFAYNEQEKLRLCIELQGEEQKSLIQAKLHGNEFPDEREAALVKKWCDLCAIDTSDTSDLEVLTQKHEVK